MDEQPSQLPFRYFHGVPGAPEEWLFRLPTARAERLRGHMVSASNDACCPAIGFSLGAYSALQFALRHPARVSRLELISPAAPLELGTFLPDMAGAQVFRAAQKGRAAMSLVALGQALALKLFPGAFHSALFAGVDGSEGEFAADPEFRCASRGWCRHALGKGRADYVETLVNYVQPWAAGLANIGAPVRIWQGADDAWAPPAMARALASALPGKADCEMLDGLGHYTTLYAVRGQLI